MTGETSALSNCTWLFAGWKDDSSGFEVTATCAPAEVLGQLDGKGGKTGSRALFQNMCKWWRGSVKTFISH